MGICVAPVPLGEYGGFRLLVVWRWAALGTQGWSRGLAEMDEVEKRGLWPQPKNGIQESGVRIQEGKLRSPDFGAGALGHGMISDLRFETGENER